MKPEAPRLDPEIGAFGRARLRTILTIHVKKPTRPPVRKDRHATKKRTPTGALDPVLGRGPTVSAKTD